MKKTFVLILGSFLLLGLKNLNAQNVITIKPFKPSKEDAVEIDKILKSLDSKAYEIKVIQKNGKVQTYGTLKSGDVKRVGEAKSVQYPGNFAAPEQVVQSLWIEGAAIAKDAAKRLQAIAAKYQ